MIARSLLTQTGAEDVRIFYSYSRRDESWRKEIDRLLPEFEWDVAVRTWYDGEIEPGTEWEPEIDRNLQAADVILLFVGQAFVDSRYCREVELPVALTRHARGEARVVPIILEETNPDWRQLEFARLQVLPQNGVPVSAWSDRAQALEVVVQGLVDLLVRQGLHHDARTRWELHLSGDAAEFTRRDRLFVTTELRRITGDETLRCVNVGSGSIVLAMESSQDALAFLRNAFGTGKQRAIGRWRVSLIRQLYGAGVRASSSLVEITDSTADPDIDSMLLPSRKVKPALIKGISVNDEDPLKFKTLGDPGDFGLHGEELDAEWVKLLDHFETLLVVPEDDLYVNLAPHETARLLHECLAGRRLGSSFLEIDYRLKRLAASLLHPDMETGRQFWKEVTGRCDVELGTRAVPIAAFQRVWIVPEKAVVWEGTAADVERVLRGMQPAERSSSGQRGAFVLEKHLKAMTEQQYLSCSSRTERTDSIAEICDRAFSQIVLPVVEAELNDGENFRELQQIYHLAILAKWFKNRYRHHPRVSWYLDSRVPRECVGVETRPVEPEPKAERIPRHETPERGTLLSEPEIERNVLRIRSSPEYRIPANREYFERYLDLFERGVFYIERDELVASQTRKRRRAYVAGAVDFRDVGKVLQNGIR